MPEGNEVQEVKVPTELVKPRQVAIIRNMLGMNGLFVDWSKIDYTRGRGILDDNNRCLWTTDGHRITFSLTNNGGMAASVSEKPDPDIPPAVYTMEEYYG